MLIADCRCIPYQPINTRTSSLSLSTAFFHFRRRWGRFDSRYSITRQYFSPARLYFASEPSSSFTYPLSPNAFAIKCRFEFDFAFSYARQPPYLVIYSSYLLPMLLLAGRSADRHTTHYRMTEISDFGDIAYIISAILDISWGVGHFSTITPPDIASPKCQL